MVLRRNRQTGQDVLGRESSTFDTCRLSAQKDQCDYIGRFEDLGLIQVWWRPPP